MTIPATNPTSAAAGTVHWLDGAEEDIEWDFAMLGIDLAKPPQGPACDAAASVLLGLMKGALDDAARYTAARDLELQRIGLRYAALITRAEARARYMEDGVKALALNAGFGNKSSRAVGFGTYGRRQVPERVTITDKSIVLAWAKDKAPELVRQKVVEDVLLKPVEQYMKSTGEIPPGVECIPAHVEAFARPE